MYPQGGSGRRLTKDEKKKTAIPPFAGRAGGVGVRGRGMKGTRKPEKTARTILTVSSALSKSID